MPALAPAERDIFAGNRAVGRIALSVAAAGTISRRRRLHEAGALRLRFPNTSGDRLEAVIVNTAGGMTGGDRFNIDVDVGSGARLAVTTAAAEKIYRSLGADTEIAITLKVERGGALAWLPQESILFDRARLHRTFDIDVAPDAGLLLAEGLVFGRAAMGETIEQGHVFDHWRVRRGGALLFAETLRLDGAIAQKLGDRAIAAGGIAVASVLKLPGDENAVAAVRALQENFAGEVGVSCWNGLVVARLVARDGAALRRDLIAVLTALGDAPLPRLWLS